MSIKRHYMETILAPTDFSKPSDNAVTYAAEVAKLTKAKLILLHVYSIPITSGESAVLLPPWTDIQKDCLEALEKKKRTLIHKHGKTLQIDCVCKIGYAIAQIVKECITENNVDLVVMGLRGAGYLSEKLIGSVTIKLIKRSNCPVLVINEKVKFKTLKQIVLAYDYETILNKSVLNPLKTFVNLFNAHVFVLNVVSEDQESHDLENAVTGIGIESHLERTQHSYQFIRNEDFVAGINNFIANKKADMLVVIPRKHKLLSTLFHESNTKRMAFHTTKPLLALHE